MKNRLMLFAADVIALTLSACFGLFWFPIARNDFIFTLVVLASVKIFLFAQAGLYRAILRFAGLSLASSILRATTAASIVVFALVRFFFVALIRFSPRYFSEKHREKGSKKVLIYGAGDLGEDVARKLLRNPEEYQLIGFIDDNKDKIGKRLHNFPIWGPADALQEVVARARI